MAITNQEIIYLKINIDNIFGRNIKSGDCHTESSRFSSNRLLIGNFTEADRSLKKVAEVIAKTKRWWYQPPLKIVVHPVEKVDGGISEVERRLFHELAATSFLRAKEIVIWEGKTPTDEELISINQC